ncbi:Archaemetzincin-1 [Perkinsus olseni]|uniref:Archaemetzincin-1 n=1 Tax=Perkinsus olseni TaxID=32597 RepID=A0A7J6NW82_PEROL|nr:Archaemetzincin-1 [Perkinsus olseni]
MTDPIGCLAGCPPTLKACLQTGISDDDKDDVLGGQFIRLPNQSGESFEDFKLKAKENPEQLARVIEIVPIILTDKDAVDVLASIVPPLHDFLEAFFPSVEASVRRAQTMKSPAGDLQLILKKLVGSKPRVRQPPLHRLGLVCRLPVIQQQNDASSAQPPCTCTCCSLGPSVVQPGSNAESWLSMICLERLAFPLATREQLLERICKAAAHNVCHSLGMGHCHFYKCLMNVAYTGESFEHIPSYLCPVCLRKLWQCLRFDPLLRYQRLSSFWESRQALSQSKRWYDARLQRIKTRLISEFPFKDTK